MSKNERCPADCKVNRDLFTIGSKQRIAILHDTVGQCAMCGKIITGEMIK